MASWDNVTLPSPPNGPAYINAAMNAFNTIGQGVNNAFGAYQKGQEFQYQQRQRDFFQNPDNQAMLQDAIQSGKYAPLMQAWLQSSGTPGIPAAAQLIPLLQRQQLINQELGNNGGGNPNGTGTANIGPGTSTAGSGPANIDPNIARIGYSDPKKLAAGSDDQLYNTRTLAATIAPNSNLSQPQLMEVASRLGLADADTDIPDDQRVQAGNLIKAAIASSKNKRQGTASRNNGGINPVAQPGTEYDQKAGANEINSSGIGGSTGVSPLPTDQGGTRQPSSGGFKTAQAAPPQTAPSQAAPPRTGNAPTGAAAMVPPQFRENPQAFSQYLHQQADDTRRRSRLGELIGVPSKTAEDRANAMDKRADQIDEQIGKDVAQTTEQKNAATGVTQRAAGATEIGKAIGKQQGEVVEAGGPAARQTINTLDIMEDAVRRSGGNFTTGPGAALALQFKQAVNSIIPKFFDPQAVVDAEVITKLNAKLAADSARAMTARPSQLEFKAFMANNPGLANSPQGSLFLISILRQQQEQNIKLSQLARVTDQDQWGKAEDAFYKDPANKLVNPFTGKPFSGKERMQGMQGGGGGESVGAPPVGHIQDGYRFKGGNHRDPNNWAPVSNADRT